MRGKTSYNAVTFFIYLYSIVYYTKPHSKPTPGSNNYQQHYIYITLIRKHSVLLKVTVTHLLYMDRDANLWRSKIWRISLFH